MRPITLGKRPITLGKRPITLGKFSHFLGHNSVKKCQLDKK